ncbi:MAG: hypothetical protein NZV14_02805 [Bryobacteraceae bacterium]|nr:hypothetical protein [Bryobacteraceae bacterium]MDW8377063.1 hypothetical protein [Bryobacterales bacterium]
MIGLLRSNPENLSFRRLGDKPLALCLLALLAIVPYLPFLGLPLISDDYLQIHLARQFSGWRGVAQLISDPLYRCRATSLVWTYLLDAAFGVRAPVYYAAGIFLHVLNTWVVFALGRWRLIGYRWSAWAAAFFAVYEGHQEAVVWHAASPELFLFLFSNLSLLFWVRWLQAGKRAWRSYWVAGLFFLLALASKEPAVMIPLLLAFVSWSLGKLRESVGGLALFAGLSIVYTVLIFTAREKHLHFNDGTFSPSAPFLWTLVNSGLRLFWFWGLLAVVTLWLAGWQRAQFLARLSSFWIVVTLLPYSFLTYMPRVPSRHTYWASAGLSLVVAAGLLALARRGRAQRLIPWVAALMFAHNAGYLWIKKLPQFKQRAAVTERFVEFARKESRPIRVRCFEVGPNLARLAVVIRLNRPSWTIRLEDDPPLPGESEAEYCSQEPGRREP